MVSEAPAQWQASPVRRWCCSRFARQHALEFLERQKGGPGEQLSQPEAMDVALEAQQVARRQIRKTPVRPKRTRGK